MKKVAIITITNSGLNFGNRLQNYALQEILRRYNLQVETIYSSNVCMESSILSKLRRRAKMIVKNSGRRRYFNQFNKKYVVGAKRIHYGKLNETSFKDEYDAFIAGSDQVWNPNFHFNSDFEFMTFAPPEKRFSYAASFGVDHIEEAYREDYRKWLKGLCKISVREFSGGAIIKELTGIEALIHVDPTMLLTKEVYQKLEKRPNKKLPKRYLLMYFLGERLEEYEEFIEKVAQKEGLEIVVLSELKNTSLYHIGPQHFLYLFHHAEYICTDSFHGTALSILFEREFTVFYRKCKDVPMNDRVDTLLQKLKLKSRLYGERSVEESTEVIDYLEISKCLEKERGAANDYIEEICQLL
jgi:hypothetical protein